MATKVFLKWLGTNGENGLTTGKEYVFHKSPLSCEFVVNDFGTTLYTNGLESYWQRIERQTFTAHGFQWFAHVPGEPMPCDGDAIIHVLMTSELKGSYDDQKRPAKAWHWEATGCNGKVGWRYADSEQKEPEACVPAGKPNNITFTETGDGYFLFKVNTAAAMEDESERNDLIAAVDDGHLTPGQKAYINAKEEKVAERLRSEAAKEELKKADHSKSIQDLANANGAVKFEHDHRLGWVV